MKVETILDVFNIITSGESQSVEFKSNFSSEVGNTICAFANTNKGIIFLGVSDDGRIRGVSESTEEKVANVAHSCKPSIYPEIKKAVHNGKLMLIVKVPPSKGVLHSFKNVVYRRVGTSDMPLSFAICHRDYFSTANVHVSIYDDRIEVWNPGGLPPELTVEDLKRPHRSIPRNPLIANALFLVKYIERWGSGTERIVKDTLAHGLPEPEFREATGGLEVMFRKAEAFLESLNERQKKAWEYLREKETINRSVYSELCECSIRTAFNDLQDMVKKGLLKRAGKGKNTVYQRLK